MLFIGRGRQRTCAGVTRREFVQVGASTILGLSLADLLKLKANNSYDVGSARSVIFLWLWGGVPQHDTFDPKPNAPAECRGPFAAIPTRTAGVRVGELFPQIAALQDKFGILRSLHSQSNDHGVAGTIGLTGSATRSDNLGGPMAAGSVRPATGSVIARARGFRGALPPFMVIGGRLHQGKRAITGEGGGTLGALYDPFRIEYDADQGTRIAALQLPTNLTPERLQD